MNFVEEEEGEGDTRFAKRIGLQVEFGELPTVGSSASTILDFPKPVSEDKGIDDDKGTFAGPFFTHIDYYDEAGSLLIEFTSPPKRMLKSEALVVLGLSDYGLASVEILLGDKEVAKKLSEVLKPYRYR